VRPLRIDFSAPSLRREVAGMGRGVWLAAAIGLIACVGGLAQWRTVSLQQLADEASMHSLLAQRERLAAQAARAHPPRAAAPSPGQAEAVNAAVIQLNLPWRALLQAVEAATPPSVALLALEPDGRRHSFKVTAEVRTSADMLDYVTQLKRQELFDDVVLTRHETNEQDAARPLRFQVEAHLRERAP
jgi:Tfp pilus assembly protein PilN